ncbi:MAG: DUF3604 domain-containing protein, partial [Planctomycetes bacterium]|nr:DUF3604 domain-containing protein [Planctomycetota bacterium]
MSDSDIFYRDHRLGARADSQLSLSGRESPLRLFWGDLHNHNAVGYAQGSLARSIDLAREHLDFFAFTGHASWHDMPRMPGERHMKWVRGFEAHAKHWPQTVRMIREANSGDFVAILGYEWHSSSWGDYCLLFADGEGELFLPDTVDDLFRFAEQRQALAIPHHVAYKQGWRGANWSKFQPRVSPVVEIFSEHGCTESDRSPFPMIRHSNGGRATANTITRQLARNLRFGFVASSDDHLGYPGAYGEGVVGVWADDLSREAIFAAIRARRTFAATGDRIQLEVSLNGQPMGAEIPFASDREIDVCVTGQDSLAMIELIRNGRVIERFFPEDHVKTVSLPGRAKCRLQYGWGPWADLNLDRICDWDITVRIDDGRFLQVLPCFQTAPFDEDRRDVLRLISAREFRLRSATTRKGAYGEDPTKSVVMELEGNADSLLTVQLDSPIEQTFAVKLGDLIDDNRVEFTGVFTSESFILGRLIFPDEFSAKIRWQDRRAEAGETD